MRQPVPSSMLIQKDSVLKTFCQRWGLPYAGAFICVIFLATIGYWIAIKRNTGLLPTYNTGSASNTDSASNLSFWDCLHFSTVTISSLGYGDIRPIGIGRFIAGVEVLLGLTIVGLWISCLASRRTEILLERIHGHAIDERFKEFRESIQRLSNEYEQLAASSATNSSNRRFSSGAESTEGVLDELHAAVDGVARYLRYEVKERHFFETTGARPFGRLLGAATESVGKLKVSTTGMMASFPTKRLHGGNVFRLSQIVQRFEVIARCACEQSPHQEHQSAGKLLAAAINEFDTDNLL